MQSMLFTVDGNEIGGDNTGECTNEALASCGGKNTNTECTNLSLIACDGSTNTKKCHNYLEPPVTNMKVETCGG